MSQFRSAPEPYTLAQFARRVRIAESRARALYAAGKLPPPDGHDADGRPLWAATTIDAWCRRTGRAPAEEALWLWRPEAVAAEPAPVLFHGIAPVTHWGQRYGMHAVVWDTPHGHVISLTPLADAPVPNLDAQPLAAAALIEPVFWPDAVIAVQLGAEYGDSDDVQMQLFGLQAAEYGADDDSDAPARPRWHLFGGERTGAPGDASDGGARARSAVQPQTLFRGLVTAEDLALVIGTPVPVWLSGTCTASAVRRAEAAQPAARTLTVPGPADGWQVKRDQLEAALKHGMAEEFPAAFAVLAADLRDALEQARRRHAELRLRGTGWYLAAQPAPPELPWSVEQSLLTAAAELEEDQAADDLARLRAIEPDLLATAVEGEAYEEAIFLLRNRLRSTRPDVAFDDVEAYAGAWEGPVVELWQQSMTPVDDPAAALRTTRRGQRLARHADAERLVGMWRDAAGRYVAAFHPDIAGNPPAFVAEWPYAPPAGWSEQTVIAADPGTGAVLAITPQPDGQSRVEPLPFEPDTGPAFRHGYSGGSPYSLYQALIRAAIGTVTAPFTLNDVPHDERAAQQRRTQPAVARHRLHQRRPAAALATGTAVGPRRRRQSGLRR